MVGQWGLVAQTPVTALPQVSRGFARGHRGRSGARDELALLLAWKLAVRGFHVGGRTSEGGPASWCWGFLLAAAPCAVGRGFLLGVGLLVVGHALLSRSTTSDHSASPNSAAQGRCHPRLQQLVTPRAGSKALGRRLPPRPQG